MTYHYYEWYTKIHMCNYYYLYVNVKLIEHFSPGLLFLFFSCFNTYYFDISIFDLCDYNLHGTVFGDSSRNWDLILSIDLFNKISTHSTILAHSFSICHKSHVLVFSQHFPIPTTNHVIYIDFSFHFVSCINKFGSMKLPLFPSI